ncbi:MAG: hypothetical protein AAGG47_01565 [Pseudomonadota bacterium]
MGGVDGVGSGSNNYNTQINNVDNVNNTQNVGNTANTELTTSHQGGVGTTQGGSHGCESATASGKLPSFFGENWKKSDQMIDLYNSLVAQLHVVMKDLHASATKQNVDMRTQHMQHAKDLAADLVKQGWQDFGMAIGSAVVNSAFQAAAGATACTSGNTNDLSGLTLPLNGLGGALGGAVDGIKGKIDADHQGKQGIINAQMSEDESFQSDLQSFMHDVLDMMNKMNSDLAGAGSSYIGGLNKAADMS